MAEQVELVAQELCQLTPVELDQLRHEHPEFGIPGQVFVEDAGAAAERILEQHSPGDAVALIQRYSS